MLRLFIVFIVLFNTSYAQSNKWMSQDYKDILKSMNLVYKEQKVLNEVIGSYECFNDHPILQEIISCAGHQLQSDDGEFTAFIPIYKPVSRMDSIDMKKTFPQMPFDVIDKIHINNARNAMKWIYGEKAKLNWKNYLAYLPAKEAKRKFNADTAFTFRTILKPGEYYNEKYNHFDALYIQKNGQGYINFFCFYSDKAAKKLPEYWKAIEGIFRYGPGGAGPPVPADTVTITIPPRKG